MAIGLSSRRRVLGSAGVLIGAGLLSGAPSIAREAPKKKGADVDVTPPEDLMREHGVLDRVLLIYEAGIRRLGDGEDMDPAVFTQSAEIIRDFIENYHEKSEEEYLFPRFRNAGRMVPLVDVLQAQHVAGRKLTERILAAAPASHRERAQREAMTGAMQSFTRMYRPHAAREDTDLFPTLRSLVTTQEFEDLADTFERKELALFGANGFEKFAKRVAEIETQIGIHDLDKFTPQ